MDVNVLYPAPSVTHGSRLEAVPDRAAVPPVLRYMSQPPKAMNLHFRDPAQRAAIEAATRKEGVSPQEYILSAAYARATAAEEAFLKGFRSSMAFSGKAFEAEPSAVDASAEQREAEHRARQEPELGKQDNAPNGKPEYHH